MTAVADVRCEHEEEKRRRFENEARSRTGPRK
jgi:hypothetical protein